MKIDFTKQGKVMILMTDCIDSTLDNFDSDMDRVKSTPAASHLFNLNPDAKPLTEGKAQVSIIVSQRHVFVQTHVA